MQISSAYKVMQKINKLYTVLFNNIFIVICSISFHEFLGMDYLVHTNYLWDKKILNIWTHSYRVLLIYVCVSKVYNTVYMSFINLLFVFNIDLKYNLFIN